MNTSSEADGRRERRIAGLESHLRAQYAMAIACVAVLAVTGLPQKYESFWLCRQVLDLAGGIETVRLVHRVAGVALVLTGVYHVVLVLTAALALGEPGPLRMIPTPGDFRDAVRASAYFMGLADKPENTRGQRYLQKVDYWFVAWSIGLMAATGIINMVPFRAARFLSADNVLAALRTHSDAAPLVVVWVFVVHLMYTGLAPRLFHGAVPRADEITVANASQVAPAHTAAEMRIAAIGDHGPADPGVEDWEALP